ncbi:hypothetical protein CH063_15604 [Colletotrichum higginsianum]|uniref:Uncharacterized protein n=1 Tax=Colletotrichum higginsianum (strain IMI 349063) TaxID=759273 RepID=H1W3K2_COLHI|nr:hypothetical protein CH063_15604 [Colletotrichum higginsianum]
MKMLGYRSFRRCASRRLRRLAPKICTMRRTRGLFTAGSRCRSRPLERCGRMPIWTTRAILRSSLCMVR